MICAFRPILLHDPDYPVCAILRIKGRGRGNKKMLGPSGGCAVMISLWSEVEETLHVTEGVETGLAVYQLGQRPTWALGSAGAIDELSSPRPNQTPRHLGRQRRITSRSQGSRAVCATLGERRP